MVAGGDWLDLCVIGHGESVDFTVRCIRCRVCGGAKLDGTRALNRDAIGLDGCRDNAGAVSEIRVNLGGRALGVGGMEVRCS